METIKIIVCGGINVGKTSILRRLSNLEFIDQYEQTTGVNMVDFILNLSNQSSVKIQVIDVGGDLINSHEQAFFENIISKSDGLFIMVDISSQQSIKDLDLWMDYLIKIDDKNIMNKVLLVNKADLIHNHRVVSEKALDNFISMSGISSWAYTVGHCDLVDLDYSRGKAKHQHAVEDLFQKMVLLILQKRYHWHSIYKFIELPLLFEYQNWSCLEFEDLDK
eukprot:gene13137-17605_t